jgi:hypothetical protein
MERRPRPLLSRYEEALTGAGGTSKMHPRDEVTSADKIYSSTLLDTNVASAQVSDISRCTKVGAETTDDE